MFFLYNELWKEFEKSGNIESYLKYRRALENELKENPDTYATASDMVQTESKSYSLL